MGTPYQHRLQTHKLQTDLEKAKDGGGETAVIHLEAQESHDDWQLWEVGSRAWNSLSPERLEEAKPGHTLLSHFWLLAFESQWPLLSD